MSTDCQNCVVCEKKIFGGSKQGKYLQPLTSCSFGFMQAKFQLESISRNRKLSQVFFFFYKMLLPATVDLLIYQALFEVHTCLSVYIRQKSQVFIVFDCTLFDVLISMTVLLCGNIPFFYHHVSTMPPKLSQVKEKWCPYVAAIPMVPVFKNAYEQGRISQIFTIVIFIYIFILNMTLVPN